MRNTFVSHAAVVLLLAIPFTAAFGDDGSQGPKPLVVDKNYKSDDPVSRNKCLRDRPAFGDLAPLGLPNWSVGSAISTQAVKYTFGTKKASSNVSAGAGLAIRYYGKSPLGTGDAAAKLGFTKSDLDAIKQLEKPARQAGQPEPESGKYYDKETDTYYLPLHKIAAACRASTSDIGKDRDEKLAASIFSITPTIYYSKLDTASDLSLQPALLVGFFDDIISVGPGFNLTGPDKGKVFLVLSLGYGFKF
jgi:hypothetical protein